MDSKTKARYEARARVLKALGHPTRLFMVDQLMKGERNVGQLTAAVGFDTSTVSRHLAQLRDAGIVEVEKRGQQVWCRLRVPCVVNFFECVEKVLEANAAELSNAIKLV